MRDRRDKSYVSFRQQARQSSSSINAIRISTSVAKQRTLVDAIRSHNETINVERLIDEEPSPF